MELLTVLGPIGAAFLGWFLGRASTQSDEKDRREVRHQHATIVTGLALHRVLRADREKPKTLRSAALQYLREKRIDAREQLHDTLEAFLETASLVGGDTWTTALRVWAELSWLSATSVELRDTAEVDEVLTSFNLAYPTFDEFARRATNAQGAIAIRATAQLTEGGDDGDQS